MEVIFFQRKLKKKKISFKFGEKINLIFLPDETLIDYLIKNFRFMKLIVLKTNLTMLIIINII